MIHRNLTVTVELLHNSLCRRKEMTAYSKIPPTITSKLVSLCTQTASINFNVFDSGQELV